MTRTYQRSLSIRAAAGALAATAFCLLPVLTAGNARGEDYPTRATTIVVPFPAGTSPDGIARLLATRLADRLGKPFIVENRPGAGSLIAASAVAKAEPDGHTLLMGGVAPLAINATLRKSLPYDPAKDFVPIALAAHAAFVLVVKPSLPVHSLQDLIKLAKEQPGKLSYGSAGAGSPPHLCTEILRHMAGIDIRHVPYKGSPQALTDIVGGHIEVMFADMPPALPLIAAGKVRALAVSSNARVPSASDIPTLEEAGIPGYQAEAWLMLVAPAGTPAGIVSKLHAEVLAALALPESRDWIIKNGLTPAHARSAEELKQFVRSEIARWGRLIEQIGIARSQ
jgi:tripartite-type tricarboxylate transporter receptor subunit TctC